MSNGKITPETILHQNTTARRRNRVSGALNVIERLAERPNQNTQFSSEENAAIGRVRRF